MKSIVLRNGICRIEQLEPDNFNRYDFFEMRGIFETHLGFNTRGCSKELEELGYKVDYSIELYGTDLKYCDFWHYQVESMFRNEVRNNSNNSIYVGTVEGLNLKKLKRQPRDWELMMVQKWNELFGHLSNKHGWIKVHIYW